MAFDGRLANDVRARIGARPELTERQMFGGVAFTINGNMALGVSGDELMVRVGKDAHDQAETRRGARMFDLSSRPMRGWIVVAPEGLGDDDDLDMWIAQGLAYAQSLPPK